MLDTSSCDSEQSALAILQKQNAGIQSTDPDVSGLIRQLGYHPLSLKASAAYIQQSNCTTKHYINLLARNRTATDPATCVEAVFKVSSDLIRFENTQAIDLLFLMSTLDASAIPETLLLVREPRQRAISRAIRLLEAFALVQRSTIDGSVPVLSLDPLTQTLVQDELQRQGKLMHWRLEAMKRVLDIFPYGDSSHWPVCDALMPHANRLLSYRYPGDKAKAIHARLFFKVAEFQGLRGKYGEAQENLEKALDIFSRHPSFGETSMVTLRAKERLAENLYNLSKFKEAELLTRQILNTYETNFPKGHPYHPKFVILKNSLGLYVQRQGGFAEARAYFEEALAANIAFHSEEHVDTFNIRNNLASCYNDLNLFAEAEQMQREILATQTKLFGPSHHNTIYTMWQLGSTIMEQGHYPKALAHYEESLVLSETALGKEHPETLKIMNSLAIAASRMGELPRAEQIHRQLLTYYTETMKLDDGNQRVITARINLSLVLEQMGDYNDAATILEPAVRESSSDLETADTSARNVMNTLSLIYLRLGRFADAETMLVPLLAYHTREYGPGHMEVIRGQNNLAGCYQRQGKLDESIGLNRKANQGATELLGSKHPFTLRSTNNLAEAIREKAELVGRGEGGMEQAAVVELLAESAELQGRALAGREEVLWSESQTHMDTLTSRFNMGQVLQSQGKHTEAMKLYREAIEEMDRTQRGTLPTAVLCRAKMAALEPQLQ
jgi:tetratricopeptide (TPR) repeat protein